MRSEHISLSKWAKLSKTSDIFSVQTVVILTEAEAKKGKWVASLPAPARARVEASLERLKKPLQAGGRLCMGGVDKSEEDFWIAVLPSKTEMYFLLEFARDTLKQVLLTSTSKLRIVLMSQGKEANRNDALNESVADALGAAVIARTFLMPVFGKRESDQKPWQLKTLELVSENKQDHDAFEYGYATGGGTNLARYLATLPPNVLNPGTYGNWIRKICKENGIKFHFHSKEALKKMGAGAFTAVDQGNPDSEGGIYELSYSPKKKAKKTVHFVGKGLCFDTGGYDVKIGGNMLTMKGDMQGSAVALASLVTAIRVGVPYEMKAFLAVTENHISPKAYKPDEVITALNGLTIEVVNTDAEGRMVLADTLTMASKGKPDCVVDFATLTGAAVRSIGTKFSAGFTNREELHDEIRDAGTTSGERIWTFPIDSTYAKSLESKVADTLQCLKGPGPDHILAACFLSRFVEEGTPWVHIDLSAAENEGGLGHVDSLFTGFGVRWAVDFIERI
jgi:leucyl aminopeptidase